MPVSAPPLARNSASPEAQSPNRRKLLLAGAGVLALAVASFLAFTLMSSSGSSASTAVPASPNRHAPAKVATSPTPSAVPSAPALVPASDGDDPFAPLPEEAVTASASPAAAQAAPLPATDPSAATASSSSATTSSSAAVPAQASAAPGRPVQLLKSNGTAAQIEIDNKPYTVKKGSTPVAGYTVDLVTAEKVQISHAGASHSLILGELQTF